MPFSVYVIRLSKEATKQPKFVKANPEYDRRKPCVYGLPVRFARKPATSTKSYTGRVVLVGIASGFRSVG